MSSQSLQEQEPQFEASALSARSYVKSWYCLLQQLNSRSTYREDPARTGRSAILLFSFLNLSENAIYCLGFDMAWM